MKSVSQSGGFFSPIQRYFVGWRIPSTLVSLVLIIAATIGFSIGGSDGARAAIRFSARTSSILFLLAFSASALFWFWPNRITRWIRSNRRYLGVSFAGSHSVHALAIASYVLLDPVKFNRAVSTTALIKDDIGFIFIILMAATSFDRTAAFIGPTAWRWLHGVGVYVIWLVFANSFFPRAARLSFYVPFASLFIVAMLLRLAAAFSRYRAKTKLSIVAAAHL